MREYQLFVATDGSIEIVDPATREKCFADKDSGVEHTTGLPAYNAWTSVTGAPALNLPLLAVDGLPVGVQIIGQHHTDHLLTGMGKWIRASVFEDTQAA